MTYLDTVADVYKEAAKKPQSNLCCVAQKSAYLPGLNIPCIMHEMNYGCGSTVNPQDMRKDQTVLYVGVGGGLELLQFAYFTRSAGGVIGVDPVKEMRDAAAKNLQLALKSNDWFDTSFIDIRNGDALKLPLENNCIDLAAQNCLFNIFKLDGDLELALSEMHRVLKEGGKLVMSDPVAPCDIPEHIKNNEVMRAQCLSGCISLNKYITKIVEAGFGVIEVRSKRPYRVLDQHRYALDRNILLETIELAAYKTPVPEDGACVFTGCTATYTGAEPYFDDGKGHRLEAGLPAGVCDKTALALESLNRSDIIITESTWHYNGGGCC